MKRLLFCLFALGCGSSPHWSEQAQREFLTGCESQSPKAFCECALGKLEATWTEDEAQDLIASYYTTGVIPPEMIRIAAACLAA